MHDMDAKNHPPWSAFSLIHGKPLIIPLIPLSLASYRQFKTSIDLCSTIFDRKGKNLLFSSVTVR